MTTSLNSIENKQPICYGDPMDTGNTNRTFVNGFTAAISTAALALWGILRFVYNVFLAGRSESGSQESVVEEYDFLPFVVEEEHRYEEAMWGDE